MLTAAKIVETVPWIDAKYYAATQTMDEARHTEVFQRYLSEKVGDQYPMGPYLQGQVFGLLEDSRWDIAYLGMQIIIESLALAAFGEMLRRTEEPLLRKLLRYVLADEARHVAFGILSLQEFYENLSEAELKDRQEFLAENTLRSQARSTTPEMWDRLGVDVNKVLPYLMEAAGTIGSTRRPTSSGRSSPSSSRTCASSACSTPTTATSAACGATRDSSSTSSTTTPPPTTRCTTPWRATAPRQQQPPPTDPHPAMSERSGARSVRSSQTGAQDGRVAGERDAVHHPREAVVVVDRVVLGAAVVPHRQRADLPRGTGT